MTSIPGLMLRHVDIETLEARIRQFADRTDHIVCGDSRPAAECPPECPPRLAVIEIAHDMVGGAEQEPSMGVDELTAEPAKSCLQASYDQRDTHQRRRTPQKGRESRRGGTVGDQSTNGLDCVEVPTEARSWCTDRSPQRRLSGSGDTPAKPTASARPGTYYDGKIADCHPTMPPDRPVPACGQSPAGQGRGRQANTSNGTRALPDRNRSRHPLS